MEFKTNDLILRTVTENDIEEIARMWEYPHETTIDKAYEALKYMEDTHSKNRQKSICHLCLGVFQKKEPNVIIGWCGLDGEAEIGKTVLFYMIDEKYRNQGYATQCAMELINYAFEEMEYDIIYGGCAKSNIGSYRVMQKAGMVQNSFYENGDYIFSIDREAFLNQKLYGGIQMSDLKQLLDDFILNSKNILYDNLIGIYLHGSLAMGCNNEKKSDIDLLVVVENDLSREMKQQYMDMVVALNNKAPSKGIELSIVKEAVCKPFVYPTPFELHFSVAHLNWYLSNPKDYIEKMNGTDKDLAAHFTIIYHRGKTLYGKEIKSVFSEVSNEAYMDSIWLDVKNAKEDIIDDTMYIILNLCRVLAYKKERLVLSKQEGGEWALHHLSDPQYKNMVLFALEEYKTGNTMSITQADAVKFAEYMLRHISDE